MLLLAIHIVAIAMLVAVVWQMAYRKGRTDESRRWERRLARGDLPQVPGVSGEGTGA